MTPLRRKTPGKIGNDGFRTSADEPERDSFNISDGLMSGVLQEVYHNV